MVAIKQKYRQLCIRLREGEKENGKERRMEGWMKGGRMTIWIGTKEEGGREDWTDGQIQTEGLMDGWMDGEWVGVMMLASLIALWHQ